MIVELEAGTELKPCPLCGSNAQMKGDAQVGAAIDPKTRQPYPEFFLAKCQNKFCGISPVASKSVSDALSAWNRRAA